MPPSPPTPPEIPHPLRILYLSPPDAPKPTLLQAESLRLTTPYYHALPPLWHTPLPQTPTSLQSFRSEWLTPAAVPVVSAIGAWIVGAPKPSTRPQLSNLKVLLRTIKEVIDHHAQQEGGGFHGVGNEPLLLAVGLKAEMAVLPRVEISGEEWEDLGRECGGWEWVDGEAEGDRGERNEFGERVGLARLREALEAHEWEGRAEGDEGEEEDVDFEAEFGIGATGGEEEEGEGGMDLGMRAPILGGKDEREEGEDGKVEELESMMLKMQAIKDMGADMPEAERKRFAKRAVRDVMRTL